jgi:hypothetical protein
MKQRIQIIVTVTIALIAGASILSAFIHVFFKGLLFMMKNPGTSLLIILGLLIAGIIIDKKFFKD